MLSFPARIVALTESTARVESLEHEASEQPPQEFTIQRFSSAAWITGQLPVAALMPRDLASEMMAYEAGEMTRAEVREFFQRLINMGIVWRMSGSYSRIARILIERGYCQAQTTT